MDKKFRLESVVLRDIGVFDNNRIDFPMPAIPSSANKAEIHLFTGANGCGKSTLLYALAGIFDLMQGAQLVRKRYRSKDSCVTFKFGAGYGQLGAKLPEGASFESEFGAVQPWFNDAAQGIYGALPQNGFPSGGEIDTVPAYKQQHNNYLPTSTFPQIKFGFAAFAYSGQRTLTNVSLGAIQQITSSPFENALSFDSTVRPHVLVQWIANNRAQAAMARADGEFDAAIVYDNALSKITSAIREICALDVQFKMQRSPMAVKVLVDGDVVPFDGLPDGLKSIISWVADLTIRLESIPWINDDVDFFEQPIFLFLDEIDVHLHPKWQRRILPAIQKMLPNAQIFVSTHSPFVVGSVDDGWVYRLPEKGRQSGRVIAPIPAGAGKSYRLILDEVFGIDTEFDVETEAIFDTFYVARDNFIRSQSGLAELIQYANELVDRSDEARIIVETELRQISRRTGVEVRLA